MISLCSKEKEHAEALHRQMTEVKAREEEVGQKLVDCPTVFVCPINREGSPIGSGASQDSAGAVRTTSSSE